MKRFAFPPIYDFPPFWTLQDVMETKRRQCDMWCDLILRYMKEKNQSELDLGKALTTELFRNDRIKRGLDKPTAVFFLNQLVERGNAQWLVKDEKIVVTWRKTEDWAYIFEMWARVHDYQNTVFTFYELREGSDTAGEPFHMMDKEVMKKAIMYLDSHKKAKFMDAGQFDECGVRFF